MKVDVYRNLNDDCLSVRSRENGDYGRVIAHVAEAFVAPAEFVVQSAGRERVLEEERKNVHAFVRGKWARTGIPLYGLEKTPMERVTYNPYERGEFYAPSNNKGITEAGWALVKTDGVYVPEHVVL